MVMLSTVTRVAVEAVQEMGPKLYANYGRASMLRRKTAEASDSVTTFDIQAEQFLKERFASYDPTIGFEGEELGASGRTDRHWIVDPIDGTEYYIRGVPFCTTMVGLADGKEIVSSIIYNFVTGELFVAERDRGATLNYKPTSVSDRSLAEAYISVETNLSNPRSVETYVRIRRRATTQNIICCGYEFGLIAQGKTEGRICFDPYGNDYDYAPGSLLISEAGGIVKNIGSDTYDFRNHNFVAANVPVYEELSRPDSPLAAYM